MRSSRSAADPLDPGPAGFAHRGLHDGAQFLENSPLAFAAALERGAGIECDLRLTADNQVIVFHDADAWRLCASPLRIAESTLAELSRLRLGDGPIPTLATVFAFVAGRVPLLLEAKVDGDIWRWVPALRRALAGYLGPLGVMSFDPRLACLLKTNLPNVRRGLVIRDRWSALQRSLAMALADPQFLAVDRAALAKPWVARARARLPIYSWTIRTAAERAQAAVHADALIWEADGRP
ncbi:glycerophosphodiester phosphodiesterase family protein [Sphingomonas sp.]|uniref:glycerophosphodiester phosphodiesterase family protein n=1 Tax=Sphingomonas sp. TaxID=28214 RepID=UPI00286E0261|nr:glycerophosphodiester phosphodiesterase family protein [Sphingomonas sp.]